jgi:hypothetical protein
VRGGRRSRSITDSSRTQYTLTDGPEPAKFPYKDANDIIQSLVNHSEDFVMRRLVLTNQRSLASRIKQAYIMLGQTDVNLQATLARYLFKANLGFIIQQNSSSSSSLPALTYRKRKRTYKRKNSRVLTRKRRVA